MKRLLLHGADRAAIDKQGKSVITLLQEIEEVDSNGPGPQFSVEE